MTYFGGFMSTVTYLGAIYLSSYQGFTIDRSLIKNIFSSRDPPKEGAKPNVADENELKQMQMKEELERRRAFKYNYNKELWANTKSAMHWLFCHWCFCCCGRRRRKLTRMERQQKQAIAKLYTEIDLLEIIKQLRISRFVGTVVLNA